MMKTEVRVKTEPIEESEDGQQRDGRGDQLYSQNIAKVKTESDKSSASDSKIKAEFLAEIMSRQVRIVLERCDAHTDSQSRSCTSRKRKVGSSAVSFFQSSVQSLQPSLKSQEPVIKKEHLELEKTENKTPALAKVANSRGTSSVSKQTFQTLNLSHDSLAKIKLEPHRNSRCSVALQMLFVKLESTSNNMAAFVGWKMGSDNLRDQLMFQCLFCPVIKNLAHEASVHVVTKHPEAMLLVPKKPPSLNSLLYVMCSHCDYVSVETTAIWVHFATYHNIPGILSAPIPSQLDPPVEPTKVLDPSSVAEVFPFYRCCTCDFSALNPRNVAEHTIECSPNDCRSGLFAPVLKIIRPQKQVLKTYEELSTLEEFSDTHLKMFVCLRCNYFCFSENLSIEHHVRLHSGKAFVYRCLEDSCPYRATLPVEMIQHLQQQHSRNKTSACRMRCCVSLVEIGDFGIHQCLH